MNISLTYEQALDKHPTEVAAILQLVRKSRRKNKNTAPDTWSWSYSWAENVPNDAFLSFAQMLTQEEPWSVREARKPTEQRINERLANCSVCLLGNGHAADVSAEVLREHVTESIEKQAKEEQRVANLTPEQQQKEQQDALAWLMGPKNSGFMAFGVLK